MSESSDMLDTDQNCRNLLAAGAATLAGVAALAYLLSNQNRTPPIQPPLDLNDQSVAIDGKPEHRASRLCKSPDYFQRDTPVKDCHVVFDVLERGKRVSKNGPCLGARTGPNREYEWKTYQQVIDQVLQFGSGLVHTGSRPSSETFVGIFATNRPEWTIADYASQAFSMVPVPLYDTLGLDACKFIINQCAMEVVVVDTEARVKSLISLKPDLPSLKRVIMIEPMTEQLKDALEKAGLDFFSFNKMLELGKAYLKDPIVAKPEDIYSIIYTSGTTGDPKGVVLTNYGFLAMVQSMLLQSQPTFYAYPEDVHLSYLPLAHNFDRAVHVMMLMHGARIGYYSRDVRLLTDDLMALKPTLFATVPRLLNRLYDAVYAGVKNSKVKSTLLKWALAGKQKDVDRMIYRKDSIWDKIIFSKIQEKLGGRVRFVITGSAPLSTDVMKFLRCSLGCVVVEGYGQTESGAGLTMSLPGDPSIGSVGPPLPGAHIKLVDIPEMDYYVKDNIGEIWAKADFLFKGYYKEPEKTAEALDEDGWLHTGDVGKWLPNGTLKVVDRKKNIFKLSQGEYIATEKIESVYTTSPFVAQAFVEGDSFKTCLMAVVVPDELYIEKWVQNNPQFPANLEEFCKHPQAKDIVLGDMIEYGKKSGLKGFEQVKDIYLEWNLFTVENDLLTPTLKNRRPVLRKRYKTTVEELYAKHGM